MAFALDRVCKWVELVGPSCYNWAKLVSGPSWLGRVGKWAELVGPS